MIKEVFEIEPKQKSTIVIFIATCFLSFLQIFLFKKSLFEEGSFLVIGLSLALGICWSILHLIPMVLIIASIVGKDDKGVIYQNIIFSAGIVITAWITFITYRGYQYKLTFSEFIDFSINWTIVFYISCIAILAVVNIFKR